MFTIVGPRSWILYLSRADHETREPAGRKFYIWSDLFHPRNLSFFLFMKENKGTSKDSEWEKWSRILFFDKMGLKDFQFNYIYKLLEAFCENMIFFKHSKFMDQKFHSFFW